MAAFFVDISYFTCDIHKIFFLRVLPLDGKHLTGKIRG